MCALVSTVRLAMTAIALLARSSRGLTTSSSTCRVRARSLRMMATDSSTLRRRTDVTFTDPLSSSYLRHGLSTVDTAATASGVSQSMRLRSTVSSAVTNNLGKGVSVRTGTGTGIVGDVLTRSFSGNSDLPVDSDEERIVRLSKEEEELFDLLSKVCQDCNGETSLRVAGGWVRDKLLSNEAFQRNSVGNGNNDFFGKRGARLTSKQASKGRKGTSIITNCAVSSDKNSLFRVMDDDDVYTPLDIDIALDNMLGREFADRLNCWLAEHGRETVSVGMVLKNPEKSKHLETATMKVGKFWIDFVNLRAEAYAEDSRVPNAVRIGTPSEDAFRRDLTINALFYNINDRRVEDFTGRGVRDLKRGVVATPLHPLDTLLDDPLRVLRSVRFAARLRFTMDEMLREAARDDRVREALAMKVSRERIGGEVDLMLRSPDPVGAMRLLINLRLAGTVFPDANDDYADPAFVKGLNLLTAAHDYLCDCKHSPPVWCQSKRITKSLVDNDDNSATLMLIDDEEARRVLWYSAFLKPHRDRLSNDPREPRDDDPQSKRRRNKRRSFVSRLMIDDLKRPARDAQNAEAVMRAADRFTRLIDAHDPDNRSTTTTTRIDPKDILLRGVFVRPSGKDDDSDHDRDREDVECVMQRLNGELVEEVRVDPLTTNDRVWRDAMEYRWECAEVLREIGSLWRPALILSLAERLVQLDFDIAIEEDVINQSQEEVRMGVLAQYDAFAASLIQLGLIGIWRRKPLINGDEMKKDHVLPGIPRGEIFREIMFEQNRWMTINPGVGKKSLIRHMRETYPYFT